MVEGMGSQPALGIHPGPGLYCLYEIGKLFNLWDVAFFMPKMKMIMIHSQLPGDSARETCSGMFNREGTSTIWCVILLNILNVIIFSSMCIGAIISRDMNVLLVLSNNTV